MCLWYFSKIHNYSPADAKAYDKPVSRKAIVKFNPQTVLDVLMEGTPHSTESEEFRTKLINDYLEVCTKFLIGFIESWNKLDN